MSISNTRRRRCIQLIGALEVSLDRKIPWTELVSEFDTARLFDSASTKRFGTDFPSYRAFGPVELDATFADLGFDVQDART